MRELHLRDALRAGVDWTVASPNLPARKGHSRVTPRSHRPPHRWIQDKDGWEIPGGYVEVGESPRAAAAREVREELGLDVDLTAMLVLDWAPHPAEGDKLLVIFDGGRLAQDQVDHLVIAHQEVSAAEFFEVGELHQVLTARLARRVAYAATGADGPYLEHGVTPQSALHTS